MIRATSLRLGARLVSNNGRGPGVAMITEVGPRWVRLERWNLKCARRQQHHFIAFSLRSQFLLSRACGWVVAKEAAARHKRVKANRAKLAGDGG